MKQYTFWQKNYHNYNYHKKIPLEWPVSVCTDILKTLTKFKKSLEDFMKQLKSLFFLLKKFYQGKNLEKEDKELFLIKNTTKESKISG